MKKTACLLLVLLCALLVAIPVYANSAEPPGMIIIAPGLPADAVITLEVPDAELEHWYTRRVDKLGESQYKLFYHLDDHDFTGAKLRITVGETSFTCDLPAGDYSHYSNILTLDYDSKTLTLGQSPWRQLVLTAIRIVLTLLVEGLVFFAVGFRSKRSWLVFLLLNLLTQGWLNLTINGYAFSSGYWSILFYFMEFVIFAVEAVAIGKLVKEHKPLRRVLCALAANAASLAIGVLVINRLPI